MESQPREPAEVAALPLDERVEAYLDAHRVLQERLGLSAS